MSKISLARIWLTTMTSSGNEENLREMIEPLRPYINGVVATFHSPLDNGWNYLQEVSGEGKIIIRNWVARHHVSMNETLFAGVIQEGDFVIWCDAMERPNPEFIHALRGPVGEMMTRNGLKVLSYYGKVFVFVYDEHMEYRGSPHWYLTGFNPEQSTDISSIWPNEVDVRLNVRPLKRKDPFGWVSHYGRYWVEYPAGSNHALLGLEKQGDPQVLFPARETRRLEFRREMKCRGFEMTLRGMIMMLSTNPLDDTLKAHINEEKTVNDVYRYHVLGDQTVVDTHLPSDMKLI